MALRQKSALPPPTAGTARPQVAGAHPANRLGPLGEREPWGSFSDEMMGYPLVMSK